MSILLDGTEHLEQELSPERMMRPAAGSVVLHLGLAAGIVLYGIIGGFFHHNLWGGAGLGGAVQVNLVSSAIPMPSTQPVNQNVLSTETPSQAPAPPTPKAKQAEDETAIPISGKQKKPEHETAQRTPPRQQEPVPTNRANYGEQTGSNIPHTSQQSTVAGPATVSDAGFGTLFPWYVQNIGRKMDANGFRSLADTRTPKGARAYRVHDLQRRFGKQCEVGSLQRKPDMGQRLRKGGAASRHIRATSGAVPRKYSAGVVLL